MIGKKINERYEIKSELGQGSMGVVYCAHDMALKRDVAIKVLSKSRLGTEGQARLLNEAQMVAKLNHPNIVTVYDVGEVDAVPFIVMELVDGKNLHEQPPKDLDKTIEIVRQLCQALDHAHEKVIIHRDIKPENVVVTSSGVTKLMDFGLARSVVSRLTTEGTIVGTVSYLAPEQALGQIIDQRADLYSLGVMLYELTTGQLPFRAKDPVAVISQHLHAPVVPPGVKNPDIPPGLANLIIRLLSKDPADRPGSAAEVRQLLESPNILDAGVPSAIEHTLLDRIVRGQIIGRQGELRRAREFWNKTVSSEGSTLLVSGEPGVGKTRLMRELVAYAEVSGGQTLVGACFPEGNGPYEAFRQIIRRGFRREPNLQDDFPTFVLAELLTLAPNLKVAFPDVPDNPPLEARAQQQRLLESVVTFCKALSADAPLLLVVEDLHWADSGTLTLFRHLVRRTRRQRIMILGTYREVELDQALPFNQVLSDLNRERLATRLKLSRLSREETCEMLDTLFAEETKPEFLDGIFFETEGNPFFIEEVCKALLESGKLHFDGERWHRPEMSALEIPQSVRVAIQSRLGKLPERVQDTLTLGAILGREFDFEALMEVSGLDEEVLIESLERAERAQLIEEISSEHGGTFTFSHAIIATTLTSGLSGLKKRRLHQRVAAVLEKLRPDDLDALAYHYTQAEVEVKALTYLTKAGDRARQTHANQDAARYYTQALEITPEEDITARFELLAARILVFDAMAERVAQLADAQEMLDLAKAIDDDVMHCKALLALAEYHRYDEFARAFDLASQALEIARSLNDRVLEAWALLQMGNANNILGKYQSSIDILKHAADLFQQEDLNADTARCLHTLSSAYQKLEQYPAAINAAERAIELSRSAGDKRQEAISLRRLGLKYWENQNFAKYIPFGEKALAMSVQIGDRDGEMDALNNLGLFLSALGKFEDGKRYIFKSIQIAEEIGSHTAAVNTYYWAIIVPLGEYEAGLKFMQTCFDNAWSEKNHSLAISCHKNIRRIHYGLGQYAKLPELFVAEIITHVEPILGKAGFLDIRTEFGLGQVLMGNVHPGVQILEDACQQLASLKDTVRYAEALLCLALARTFMEDHSGWLMGLEDIKKAFLQFDYGSSLVSKSYALCIQARLYLKLGQIENALAASTEGIEWMEEKRILHWREYCFITHVQVLKAMGRKEEADRYLEDAYERVMMIAGKTQDPTLRQIWLENVPWNREILKEAKEGLGNASVA